MPVLWEKATPYIKEKYLERYYEYRNHTKGPESLHSERINIDEAVRFIIGVNETNCQKWVVVKEFASRY